MVVGAAAGNGPHGVAAIVMGTDKQVSGAFPHQALQLLHRGQTSTGIRITAQHFKLMQQSYNKPSGGGRMFLMQLINRAVVQ